MIDPAPLGWLAASPVLLVAVLLLLLPGGGALALARFPPLVVLGAAGPLSVTLVAGAGLLAGTLGVAWTPFTLAVAVAVLGAVAFTVGRARRPTQEGQGRAAALLLAAVVVAGALGALPAMLVMGDAGAIPQQPDTIYHLGTIHSMLELEDVSTLHAVDFARPGGTGFYPAAFHAVTVSLVQLTGASLSVAANAVALVAAFVVWPLGFAALATTAFGSRQVVVLAAPFVAVAFPAFPTWFLGYGVLWPNLVGQAMLPAVVTCVVRLSRRGRSGWDLALLLVLTPGLAIAHPNAVFALVVAAVVVVDCAALGHAVRSRGNPRTAWAGVAAAVLVTAGAAGAWLLGGKLAASLRASNVPGPEATLSEALVDVSFSAVRWQRPLWVLGAVAMVGAVLLLRRRREAWILVLTVVVAGLYVVNVAIDSDLVRWVTWPWYNNPPRLAGLLVLPMALLCVAALAGIARFLERRRRRPGASWVVAVALVTGFVGVTAGASASPRQEALDRYFLPGPGASWVSPSELDALRELGTSVPDDAVVAANPYRGGGWLRLVSGERMLFPTEKVAAGDEDLALLGRRIDEVGVDPTVCRAARDLGVEYAITGGTPSSAAGRAKVPYAGVDSVAEPAWRVAARSGAFTLHRLESCAGS